MTLLFNRSQFRTFVVNVTKSSFNIRSVQNRCSSSKHIFNTETARNSNTSAVWKLCSAVSVGAVGFAVGVFVDRKLSLTSKVYASKRMVKSEANFIADVVHEALPSVVAINVGPTSCSGFIVSADGLILTNAHPFPRGDSARPKVTLWDSRVLPANVLAVDTQQDLAVLKIDEKDLPHMKLGNSSELRAGEWVVAIGSPMGLKHTVTAGVVSTKSRPGHELRRERISREFIQTDAAITYGNSGGPLINLDAEAIGINSLRMAPGISFAVPIDTAKEFLQAVESKLAGKASGEARTYLGIKMVTLSPDIIQPLETKMGTKDSIKLTEGVLIFQVEQDSPAQRGGLKRGDIVVAINGKPVRNVDDVYEATETGKSSFKCQIVRVGRQFDLEVVTRK